MLTALRDGWDRVAPGSTFSVPSHHWHIATGSISTLQIVTAVLTCIVAVYASTAADTASDSMSYAAGSSTMTFMLWPVFTFINVVTFVLYVVLWPLIGVASLFRTVGKIEDNVVKIVEVMQANVCVSFD